MRRKQQPHDLQPRFRPNRRKPVRTPRHHQWINSLHISIIAEIQKIRNLFFSETLPPPSASHFCAPVLSETPSFFAFDRVSRTWDTQKTDPMTLNRTLLAIFCASAIALPALAQT